MCKPHEAVYLIRRVGLTTVVPTERTGGLGESHLPRDTKMQSICLGGFLNNQPIIIPPIEAQLWCYFTAGTIEIEWSLYPVSFHRSRMQWASRIASEFWLPTPIHRGFLTYNRNATGDRFYITKSQNPIYLINWTEEVHVLSGIKVLTPGNRVRPQKRIALTGNYIVSRGLKGGGGNAVH